ELPGALKRLLQTHDVNGDGQLTREELQQAEDTAAAKRAETVPGGSSMTGPAATGPAGGRRGRRGSSAAGVRGSPLDAEQILRFALTFDANHDGSLSPEELQKYAVALAARRAQAKAEREAASPETSADGAADTNAADGHRQPVTPSAGKSAAENPAAVHRKPAAPVKGLGADGRGGGGFGDRE
ncbi:MAG: EF-hand domain-containing protein, partial [Planctomycetaceae bacterium]|nr:EF-hand domain-containing protein [Planctomycetaceae bacterium]